VKTTIEQTIEQTIEHATPGVLVANEAHVALKRLLDAMMLLQLRPLDVFVAIDINHDCKITKQELKAGLHRIGCADLEDEDIDRMLSECDEDGDGKLDVKEWKDAVGKCYHERHHQQTRHRPHDHRDEKEPNPGVEHESGQKQEERQEQKQEEKQEERQEQKQMDGDEWTAPEEPVETEDIEQQAEVEEPAGVKEAVETARVEEANTINCVQLVILRLAMVYPQGVEAEAEFKLDLIGDIVTALGADQSCFEIKSMRAGSIIVELALRGADAELLKTRLEAQVADKSSVLYNGKVTRHVMSEAKRKKKRKGEAEQEQHAVDHAQVANAMVGAESVESNALQTGEAQVNGLPGKANDSNEEAAAAAAALDPEVEAKEVEGRLGRRGGVLSIAPPAAQPVDTKEGTQELSASVTSGADERSRGSESGSGGPMQHPTQQQTKTLQAEEEVEGQQIQARLARRGGVLAHQSLSTEAEQSVNPLHSDTIVDGSGSTVQNTRLVRHNAAPVDDGNSPAPPPSFSSASQFSEPEPGPVATPPAAGCCVCSVM
jgi:hypothetical protein